MADILTQDEIDNLLDGIDEDTGDNIQNDGRRLQDVRTHIIHSGVEVLYVKKCRTKPKNDPNGVLKYTRLIYLSDGRIIVDVFDYEVFDTSVIQLKSGITIVSTFYMGYITGQPKTYSNLK